MSESFLTNDNKMWYSNILSEHGLKTAGIQVWECKIILLLIKDSFYYIEQS